MRSEPSKEVFKKSSTLRKTVMLQLVNLNKHRELIKKMNDDGSVIVAEGKDIDVYGDN